MKTQVFAPRSGKAFRRPWVAHGFTTIQVSSLSVQLQPLDGQTAPSMPSPVIRTTPAGTQFAFRFTFADNEVGRYNFTFRNGSRVLLQIRGVKVRRSGQGGGGAAVTVPITGGLTIQNPSENSTAASHSCLTATGALAGQNTLTEATLEYIDDQVSFDGLIVKDDNPWIATFTCPGMEGTKAVALFVRDSASNTDDIEFTLTE